MPFASIAQAGYLSHHPEKIGGKEALEEWKRATDFSRIPEKVGNTMDKPLSEAASHISHPGATKRAAAKARMSTREWAEKHKHDSDATTRARATLALGFMHAKH